MEYIQLLKFIFIEDNRYLYLLQGLQFSLGVSICASILGVIVGISLAFMKLSTSLDTKFRFLEKFATAYIDIVRGTPVVIQLLILANVIFVGVLKDVPIFVVASIAFGLNSGAYVAEIIRSGIKSVENGQMDAARALGMSYSLSMKEVILPQAIKKILPTMVNEFISLIKETSVVGFIGGIDLLRSATIITNSTYRGVEPLLCVGLIYLIIIALFTKFMRKIEESLKASD